MREGRGDNQVGLLVEAHGGALQVDRGDVPTLLRSDPLMQRCAAAAAAVEDYYRRHSSSSAAAGPYSDYPTAASGESSPYKMSPWRHSAAPPYSPYDASPWSHAPAGSADGAPPAVPLPVLVGSLVREEGQIYSLAASGELLYTGSDSKNVRIWKNLKDYAGFKSSSGLVKAIIIAGERIYTGHQDGKIRLWKVSLKNATMYKRVGTLPRLKDFIRSSLNPANYVEVRRHRSALWIRHADAISCLALSEDQGLLYSGSWDKTFKVWRVADSRCLESVVAHDDTVNALVAAFGGLVFTGSADGTVKIWRRELQLKVTKHSLVQTLLKQDSAVTSLAFSPVAPFLYCGSSDGLVNFWEGESHMIHGGVLRSHKMAVLCLAAAGNLLLSGSADKTICVWRRDGGAHTCLAVLSGHTGPVKCLAIEAEAGEGEDGGKGWHGDAASGRWTLYSGSLDKSVKVWRVYEQEPEALLKGPQHMPAGREEFQAHGFGNAQAFGGQPPITQGSTAQVRAVA